MTRIEWKRWTTAAIAAAALAAPLGSFAPAKQKPRTWVVSALSAPTAWQHTYPNWINKRGTIVGFRAEGATIYENQRAIVWEDAASEPTHLPEIPDSTTSWAGVINDRGQIAGRTGGHAVLWEKPVSDGTRAITDLHQRLAGTGYSSSAAITVNVRGDAAGWAFSIANGTALTVVWPRRGEPYLLATDDSQYLTTRVIAMNDDRIACGVVGSLPGGAPLRAVYWPADGRLVNLHSKVNEVVPAARASTALWVLDNGQVAGAA